ncbi:hypothetical protein [Endozoicomonas sp. Mp262]|uniref:hypothetical protein n=1 Tax=Endozoicomonas sp. Mp262 TaxID=2919499 RepID=UPI0021D92750
MTINSSNVHAIGGIHSELQNISPLDIKLTNYFADRLCNFAVMGFGPYPDQDNILEIVKEEYPSLYDEIISDEYLLMLVRFAIKSLVSVLSSLGMSLYTLVPGVIVDTGRLKRDEGEPGTANPCINMSFYNAANPENGNEEDIFQIGLLVVNRSVLKNYQDLSHSNIEHGRFHHLEATARYYAEHNLGGVSLFQAESLLRKLEAEHAHQAGGMFDINNNVYFFEIPHVNEQAAYIWRIQINPDFFKVFVDIHGDIRELN